MSLDHKKIVLAVSGGIAAYKAAVIISLLRKKRRGNQMYHDGSCRGIHYPPDAQRNIG